MRWLLDCVGADGIKLTGVGYLPPAHVEAAVAELGLGRAMVGMGNREVQTLPVLNLRESATQMGLMRLWLNPWSTEPGAALHRARTM